MRNLRGVIVIGILVLGVLLGSDASSQEPLDSFVILVDVSGSMSGAKLTDAKAALTEALETVDDRSVNLGLRAFSGCGAGSSTLVSKPKPNNAPQLIEGIDNLTAGGGTAIEEALKEAVADFPDDGQEHTILLVSDGAESCHGDPCLEMQNIVASGTSVVVNTIGFQTEGSPAQPQLQCIADVTGGSAISVSDANGIKDAIAGHIKPEGYVCEGQELAKCFAPVVLFSTTEQYYPMNPSDFISGSDLIFRQTCSSEVTLFDAGAVNATNLLNQRVNDNASCLARVTTGTISLASPPDPDDPKYRGSYSPREFSRPSGERFAPNGAPRAKSDPGQRELPGGSGFYLHHTNAESLTNVPASMSVAAPAFYFLTERDGITGIHYWFFYGYDSKRSNNFADNPYEHQGDWEHITVYVKGNSLQSVDYHGHACEPINKAASEFQEFDRSNPAWPAINGTHPVVLASAGSHASWPTIPDNVLGGGWPEHCPDPPIAGDLVTGSTDSFKFDGTNSKWEVSEVLEYAPDQPWYGFGGGWGDTDGPLGLPYAVSQDVLPYTTDLSSEFPGKAGWIEPPKKLGFMPLESGSLRFLDGLPGLNYKVVLESLPTVIGSGSYDANGTADITFTIPRSTPPGLHVLSVYDSDSGDLIGSVTVVVGVSPECDGVSSGIDGDSDGLSDACDDRPGDGPSDDFDGDGIANSLDNCPTVPNGDQESRGFSIGVACNPNLGNSPLASYPELPAVEIDARVNGAVSPQIAEGEEVEWSYSVTNISDAELSNIVVTDDLHGDIECPKSTLDPGDSMKCTVSEAAQAGTQRSKVSVVATRPNFDEPARAETEAEYSGVLGESPVGIDTVTQGIDPDSGDPVSGDDIRVAAGRDVVWTYTVTNKSDRELVDVSVIDSEIGAVSCPATKLEAGESIECSTSGIAITTGPEPYSNVGSVAASLDGRIVTASDASGYFGVAEGQSASIELDKVTNGHDGLTFEVGAQIIWIYTVSNTGGLGLENIGLVDDQEGPIVCPRTELKVGESMQCELHGVAVEGSYLNVATVTGRGSDGALVTAIDASNYIGRSRDAVPSPTPPLPTPVPTDPPAISSEGRPGAPGALTDAPLETIAEPSKKIEPNPKTKRGSGLAFTGQNAGVTMGSGTLLLLAGIALTVAGRRRRSAR